MVFDGTLFSQKPGEILSADRFRQVELAVAFKKIVCHRCRFAGFYRYQVLQVRRNPEILSEEEEEVRPDHFEIWKTIPRFAEIPETIKCKGCREVQGVYTYCIY